MSDLACRVSVDLNRHQAGQWECTCSDMKFGDKCNACIYNDADYFEEPDSYNDD